MPRRSAACSTVVPFFTTTGRSSMSRATSSGPAAGRCGPGGAAAAAAGPAPAGGGCGGAPGFGGPGGAGGVGSGILSSAFSASLALRGGAAEGARALFSVRVEFALELGDVRLHRPGDRLAEGADGVPLHAARHVDQEI